MEYFIILILSAAVVILAVKYFVLKKQLKSVFNQLSEEQTRLVTIELVDGDIEKVVQEINALLERVQQSIDFLYDLFNVSVYKLNRYKSCLFLTKLIENRF